MILTNFCLLNRCFNAWQWAKVSRHTWYTPFFLFFGRIYVTPSFFSFSLFPLNRTSTELTSCIDFLSHLCYALQTSLAFQSGVFHTKTKWHHRVFVLLRNVRNLSFTGDESTFNALCRPVFLQIILNLVSWLHILIISRPKSYGIVWSREFAFIHQAGFRRLQYRWPRILSHTGGWRSGFLTDYSEGSCMSLWL